MNTKYFFISMLFVSFLIACNQDIKSSKEYIEVMAIHDKIMPETSKLLDLKSEFKSFVDSTSIPKITAANVKIVQADDAMMKWMEEFKLPDDKNNAKAYLEGELTKIKAIEVQFNDAKSTGKALLEELKSAKASK
jgi:hypothetical protein